jgi:hypothetical protein
MLQYGMILDRDIGAAHAVIAKKELSHLYSFKPTLDFMANHPEVVAQQFGDYFSMFRRFFTLDQSEMSAIDCVGAVMKDSPHKLPIVFRNQVAGNERQIVKLFEDVEDPGTPQYKAGMADLKRMMTNAWDMKVAGLSPKDGDPRSDGVIWGYVRGSTRSDIDVGFYAAHLAERVATAALKDTPIGYLVRKKDWSFPISTAIVGLDGVRGIGIGGQLLSVWREPRPNGLGWISEKRIAAYQQVLGLSK